MRIPLASDHPWPKYFAALLRCLLSWLGLLLCSGLSLPVPSGAEESQPRASFSVSGRATKITPSDTLLLAGVTDKSGAHLQQATREALRAALDESPYLNLLPEATVDTLSGRDSSQPFIRLTSQQLSSACLAARAKAYVIGEIARSSQSGAFEGTLSTLDCASGVTVAEEKFTADEPRLVDALGQAAARIRLDLGEPSESVRSFDTPLSKATTSSFQALNAWSEGLRKLRREGATAAIPPLETAVKDDPDFAAAVYDLGLAYRNSGQEGRARELWTRALSIADRASRHKRLNITAQYYAFVTVDERRAVAAFRAWIQSYPSDFKAVSNFGSFYGDVCRYREAIAQFEQAWRMNPNDFVPPEDLMEMLMATGEFDRVRAIYGDMMRMKLDDDSPHLYMYVLAALRRDTGEMAAQAAWFTGKKELQHEILSEQADAAGFTGQLAQALELTLRAVESAKNAGNFEQAASWLLNSAWREDIFGNEQLAHDQAVEALAIAPGSREDEATAAIILARTGDLSRARSLVADIERRYSNHSVMQSYWLPTIRAQIALRQHDPAVALHELRTAARLDLLYPQVFFYSHVPSIVLRAEAYMLAGQPARAVEQWRTILQNPGITQLSATVPFARLQLARSYALIGPKTPNVAKALAAYQSFLEPWKDAEPDIPIFTQGRAEFARLQ
jgi:eukaryotic-like serine/threonine-protein kinase